MIKYPAKSLRASCAAVDFTSEASVRALECHVERLLDVLSSCPTGLALADNQVHEVGLSVFVVKTGMGLPEVVVNPRITGRSGESSIEEGCLSLPDIAVRVRRASFIELEYLSLSGESAKLEARDLSARVVQHEVDHLNGKLIIDELPEKLRRDIYRKSIKARAQGK